MISAAFSNCFRKGTQTISLYAFVEKEKEKHDITSLAILARSQGQISNSSPKTFFLQNKQCKELYILQNIIFSIL